MLLPHKPSTVRWVLPSLLMTNNHRLWPDSHMQQSWSAFKDLEDDGRPRSQIHNFTVLQGCEGGGGFESVPNSTLGQPSFGGTCSRDLREQFPWQEVPNQSNIHARNLEWSDDIRDNSSRRRASSYYETETLYPSSADVSSHVELGHGSLSPYPSLDGHRRAYSDTAIHSVARHSQLLSPTEPAFIMSVHQNWRPEFSHDSMHGDHGEAGSALWSDTSSWLSSTPSLNVTPEAQFTYLPDVPDRSPKLPAIVLRQNVGSKRTMQASQSRRSRGAKYSCPVSGCESTFTRRINLNGHLRAHSNERPFVCRWTACGRAFARLHDCKRHEHLHTIDPSFACNGCRKKFARLDALNRHLRSKGADQCRRAHEGNAKIADDCTLIEL